MVEIGRRSLLKAGVGLFFSGMATTKLLEYAFSKVEVVEFSKEELSLIQKLLKEDKSFYYYSSRIYQEIKDLDNNQKDYSRNQSQELKAKIDKNKSLIRVYAEIIKIKSKNVKNNF